MTFREKTIKYIKDILRAKTISEVIQLELQEAHLRKLEAETAAEYANAAMQYNEERIARLESQEPVGRFAKFTDDVWRPVTDYSAGVPLYAHPPQRTWVDLTPEEILEMFDAENVYGSKWLEFARAVENKLKQKNT